jgi:uncharacterized protein (DUF362 family)/NAD-dependent dihydropyrimidine dehydrogenase PreA subunit
METVQIVTTDPKLPLEELYHKGNDLLRESLTQYTHLFKKGDHVLVKPNLLSARDIDMGVTTHPKTLDVVLKFLLELETVPFVGDSPPDGNGYAVAKKTGLIEVCEKYNVNFVELDEPVKVKHSGEYDFSISKKVLDADKIVSLAKLKTHSLTILTLAVKNTFGCIPGKEKASWHFKALNNNNFAKLMVEICSVVNPTLNIVDGLVAHEGNGPSNGKPKRQGVIFLSENPFALDDAIASCLEVPRKKYPILIEAGKKKLIPQYQTTGEWSGSMALPKTSLVFSGLNFISNRFNVFKKKPSIDKERCIKCRKCERNCPVQAIDIDSFNIDYSKCIRCYVCHEVCRKRKNSLKFLKTIDF